MAYGNKAIFSLSVADGSQAPEQVVDWETDYVGSPVVPKKTKFDIKEGNTPPVVAKNLADAFNNANDSGFKATATGAAVLFTAPAPYKVDQRRFTIDGKMTILPGDGANVPMGNTRLSVRNANGNPA